MEFSTKTVALWFKADSDSGTGVIFDEGGTTRGLTIRVNDGNIEAAVRDASTQATVSSSFAPGAWTHVATTFDSGLFKLYVHGAEQDSVTAGFTSSTQHSNDAGLGGRAAQDAFGNTATGDYFGGLIDDVRIYDNALSAGEIAEFAGGYPQSYNPTPGDGAIYASTWANLAWTGGTFAVSHDVYFGTTLNDVNDGAEGTFVGNTASTFQIVGFPGFPVAEGLAPGTTYYWRVDEVNGADPNSPWRGDVWSFMVPPRTAYNADPLDGIKFITPDVTFSWTSGFGAKLHNVYLGESFDDVNSATGALLLTDPFFTPGTLEFDKTYYWRVDEFDGFATHRGDVWTLTTRPDIPVTDDPNLVAWWTFDEGIGTAALDWSGHGNHGELFGTEWTRANWLDDSDGALSFADDGFVAIDNINYSGGGRTEVTVCAWIRTSDPSGQYILSFDRNEYYRLEIAGNGGGPGQIGWDVMTMNGGVEQQIDYGSVTRVDDGLWHHVAGVFDRGRATIFIDGIPERSAVGGPTYGIGDLVRFGFIGANSEATAFNGTRGSGTGITGDLGDLHIYDKALTQEEILALMRGDPLVAWDLRPTNGRITEIDDVTSLSWRPGDGAPQHDVYFGSDADAVAGADASDTAGAYRGRQSSTVYTPPEGFDWGQSYYWRVDEFNADGTIATGRIRTINVADYLVVEGFEDYNDYPPDEIWNTWIDGYATPMTNGALVGHPDPLDFVAGEHYVETGIVQSGRQSMPLYFDTNFKSSEAARTFVPAGDWTGHGVEELSLWYFGDPCNVAEQMYVAVTGGASAVVYNDDPNLITDTWTQWIIPLQTLTDQGVNLANVTRIALGFGTRGNTSTPGSSGVVFFDEIRLRRTPVPPVITVTPLGSLEAERDPANADTLTAVLKINGTDASVLIVGTTTTDFEKFADHPAADADNLDLTTYGSLDDSTVIQTVFAQPVTTIFMMERGANDSGFFQALDAHGNPAGEMVAFTAADFQLPDAGLKIVDQDAGGIAIESDVPISGLLILPPEGGVHGIDPASISAIPAP
ncbi:MAG: LamG domain-containing protein [Phycisphaerae bacterium]|nr:LamG domain-containing protein [Phycisphaerae bacterium]